MNLPSCLALLGMCLILVLPLVPFARHLNLTVSLSHQTLRPSKADNPSHRMSATQMTQQPAMIRTSADLGSFPARGTVASSQIHIPQEYQGAINSNPTQSGSV